MFCFNPVPGLDRDLIDSFGTELVLFTFAEKCLKLRQDSYSYALTIFSRLVVRML